MDDFPDRYGFSAPLSYITGTHNVRVGIQDTWGSYRRTDTSNADLRAIFLSGVATSAVILNSSVEHYDKLMPTVGVYAQDSWTLNAMTVNYGARYEHFAHGIPTETSPAGRFHRGAHLRADRHADVEQHFATRAGLSTTSSATRRRPSSSAWAGTSRLDPPASPRATTRCSSRSAPWPGPTRTWTGVPQGELGCVYQTPGCEINLAQLPKGFGVASLANFDPDLKRMYNIETAVSVQQELRQGFSVQGGWYHRDFHNLRRRDNTLQTFADYTPLRCTAPLTDADHLQQRQRRGAFEHQLRGHERRLEPEDVVQRLRVQLQRASDARHHSSSAVA
jgi:hypothetical protein